MFDVANSDDPFCHLPSTIGHRPYCTTFYSYDNSAHLYDSQKLFGMSEGFKEEVL